MHDGTDRGCSKAKPAAVCLWCRGTRASDVLESTVPWHARIWVSLIKKTESESRVEQSFDRPVQICLGDCSIRDGRGKCLTCVVSLKVEATPCEPM